MNEVSEETECPGCKADTCDGCGLTKGSGIPNPDNKRWEVWYKNDRI
jgi:hypothetical protein